MEIWRDIEGYEGYYQVSNLGRVKSLDTMQYLAGRCGNYYHRIRRGRILVQHKSGPAYKTDNAYMCVGLCKENIVTEFNVHRLVAKSFPEICGEWFEGAEVNHKNELKYDNRAENLEWVDHLTNLVYNDRHLKVGDKLKGRKVHNQKYVWAYKDGVRVREFSSVASAGRYFGVSESCIRQNIAGINHTIKGHTFKYADGSGVLSEEEIKAKKQKDYQRKKERYNTDEEFRKRIRNTQRKCRENKKSRNDGTEVQEP